MLVSKEELKLKRLLKDPVAWLLFLNSLFVIIGYALANITLKASVGIFGDFKNIFLFGSLAYLIFTNRVVNPNIIFDSGFIPVIFGVLVLYISIGAGSDSESFLKTLTFLVPMVYVYISLSYLILQFGIQSTLRGFHLSLLLIYCLPLLSYIISGGKITETNIYGGGGQNQPFASNNYGWSATLYILSFLFVFKNIKLKKFAKIFFACLFPVALILLFVSANRSSWLSVAITLVPFLFAYKGVSLKYKIISVLVVLGFIAVLLNDPNSSINFAMQRTQRQENGGEERINTASIMINNFNDNKTKWLTGVGMYNFTLIKNKVPLSTYHNSYLEVLFGAGIFLFLLFLTFMVFRPIKRYMLYYYKYSLLLPPLLILPFFESDLTGGQFLFFPWFTFIFLLNAKIKFWNKETYKESLLKSNNKKTILDEANNTII